MNEQEAGGPLEPEDITTFWFSDRVRERWFDPDPAFDAELKARYEGAIALANSDALDLWRESPQGALALVILLDQIPRNIYRGSPEAFAYDERALALAKEAIARGHDKALGPQERQFLYLPFMHSEALAEQERGMALYTELGLAEPLDFMKRHRDIIARFGRFPHRNATLGRASTGEELAFLEEPGSSF